MMKHLLRFTVGIYLFGFLMSQTALACRMWGAIATEGNYLSVGSNQYAMKQHLYWGSDETNLKLQANYYHTDGWGMLNYVVSPGSEPSLAEVFRSEVAASSDMNFVYGVNDLVQTFPNVSTLLAHVRRASSGAIEVPDPHPWIKEMGGVTYSFEHNGTIHDKLGMKNLIGVEWIELLGGFD